MTLLDSRRNQDPESPLRRALRALLERGRAIPGDIARQTGRGLAESGYATAIGTAEIADWLGEKTGIETLERIATPETARARRAEMQEFYGEPETLPGTVYGAGARVGGDVAQFLAPGGAVSRGAGILESLATRAPQLARYAGAASRAAKPATRAGEFVKDVATGAPVSQVMAAAGPEESSLGGIAALTGSETLARAAENPLLRGAAELGIDVLGAGGAAALPRGAARALPETAPPARAAASAPEAVAWKPPETPLKPKVTDDGWVELRGDELGDETVPIPEFQKRAHEYGDLLRGSIVRTPDRWPVVLNKVGLKHTISTHGASRRHLQSVPGIPALLENSRLIESLPNTDPTKKSVLFYHRRVAQLRMGGEDLKANMLVRETNEGRFFYDHDLTEFEPGMGPERFPVQDKPGGASPSRPGSEPIVPREPEEGQPGGLGPGTFELAETSTLPPPGPRVVAADVNPDEFLRIQKFGLGPEAETLLRSEAQRVLSEQGVAPKTVQSLSEVANQARSLGLEPDSIRKALISGESAAEHHLVMNIVGQNTDRLASVIHELETGVDLVPSAREALEAERAARSQINDAFLARFVRMGTSTARALNARKMLAAKSTDPAVWLHEVKRALGDRPLTDEIQAETLRLARAKDRTGLAKLVQEINPPGWGEKWGAIRKAGLLSGPKSHLKNAMSNTVFGAMEVVKDVPAYVVDEILRGAEAIVSGGKVATRTKAFPSVRMLTASARGARKGVDEAIQIMRGATMPDDMLRKYDQMKRVHFQTPALDFYVNKVLDSYGAADRPFRGAGFAYSLEEQAIVMAKGEGASGPELAARIEHWKQNPTQAMLLRATGDAEFRTFQRKTVLGDVALGIKRGAMQKSQLAGAAAEQIIPFTQTPAAVATTVAEYSPLGLLLPARRDGKFLAHDVYQILREARKGNAMPDLQKAVAERVGRVATGSAVIALPIVSGYELAKHGAMTGAYPSDQTEAAQWRLEGKIPNAIRVGGKWRSVEGLSPLGNLLALGANLHAAAAERGGMSPEAAVAGTASIGKTLTEQSFLRGTEEALGALEDPEREASRFLASQVSSAIPTIARQAGTIGDPYMREQETTEERIRARVPGLSRTLEPRIDQFGQPIERDPGVIANLVDPLYSTYDRTQDDPVLAEVQRVGAEIPEFKAAAGEERGALHERRIQEGQVLRSVLEQFIESGEYQDGPRRDAEILVAQVPEFRGRDVDELEREIRKERIEDFVTQARQELARRRREQRELVGAQ